MQTGKLGFGLMRLPLTDAADYKSVDQEEATRMIDYFIEQGFTYFDTAYIYHSGVSEYTVKNALVGRHSRNNFTIADKMPVWLVTESSDYEKYFDEQLARCGVSYFDYYLLHNLGVKSYADTLHCGGFEFMKKLKREGRARHIGFSFHDNADLLDKILTAHPEMEFVQLQINYIDWENESIQSRRCYETALKHDRQIVVMEPVKGGSLARIPEAAERIFRTANADMSTASWAIRFAASLENVLVVLSGMSTVEQLADNAGYMREFRSLDNDEKRLIRDVADVIRKSIAIACTACAYCVEGCPQSIPIPQYFALYNDFRQLGKILNLMAYFRNLIEESGKPSDCIACRQCEEHCPQHIDIVAKLRETANVFEVNM